MGVRKLGTGTPADRKRDQCRESMRKLRVERRGQGKPANAPKSIVLPPRDRRLVGNMVSGNMSVTKALVDAGYHPNGSVRKRLQPGGDLARVIRIACRDKGLTVDAVVDARVEALRADKPTGMLVPGPEVVTEDGKTVQGPAMMQMIPDHSVRLKASELGERALQAAGEWPRDSAPAVAGGSVRVLQVLPDGTRQVIEISS